MGKIINKSFVLILTLLLLITGLTACSQQGEKAETEQPGHKANVVRISVVKSYSFIIEQVIMLKDFLKDELPEGVTVEWSVVESGTVARDSLAAGQLDMAAMGYPLFITAFENGFPIVPVVNSAGTSAYLYSHNPNIKSLDDIRPTDKISVLGLGNSLTIALNIIAKEKYGIPQKFDQNLTVMGYNDAFASIMTSNDLAGAIVSFPNTMKADKIESLTPILDLTPTLRDNNIGSAIFANEKFYKENPAIINAFYRAAEKAEKYVKENSAEAARLLSEYYQNLDAAAVEKQIKEMPPNIRFSESAHNKVAEIMYEAGILTKPPKKFNELPNYDTIPKVD